MSSFKDCPDFSADKKKAVLEKLSRKVCLVAHVCEIEKIDLDVFDREMREDKAFAGAYRLLRRKQMEQVEQLVLENALRVDGKGYRFATERMFLVKTHFPETYEKEKKKSQTQPQVLINIGADLISGYLDKKKAIDAEIVKQVTEPSGQPSGTDQGTEQK